MLENNPSQKTMTALLGEPLLEVWKKLSMTIDETYNMERLWNTGGKNWTYEYKFCLSKINIINNDGMDKSNMRINTKRSRFVELMYKLKFAEEKSNGVYTSNS